MIGKQLGQYQITEVLGQGGMATVYKAYQPNLDAYVAIKVMSTSLARDSGFLERFRQEARMVARLHHPNILHVYDFGEQDGDSFIVMEYIQGGTLKDRLGRPLDLRTAAGIITQVAGALDHAHNQGIIHRDLKPSNIMVTQDGRAVLSDFGIARMADSVSNLTAVGTVIGTPEYMSPEQGQGITVDRRSDVYSLGVVVFEMLTAQVPFTANSTPRLLYKHIYDPLPSPSQINPAIPPQVESVLFKALAKAPEDRFQSAGEFGRALHNAAQASVGNFDVARTMMMFAQHQPLPPVTPISGPPAPGGPMPSTGGPGPAGYYAQGYVPPQPPPASGPRPASGPPPPVSPYVQPAGSPYSAPYAPPAQPPSIAALPSRRRTPWIVIAAAIALVAVCCLGAAALVGANGLGLFNAATAVSQATAEATAVASTNLPQTAVTPSGTARATPAASPVVRTGGKTLFEDSLATNQNNWPESTDVNQAFFQGGRYHLFAHKDNSTYRTSPGNAPRFDNFSFEATVQKLAGTDQYGYGLAFRDAGAGAFYVFEIRSTGDYEILKHTAANEWEYLTGWRASPLLNKGDGADNRLKVICSSNEIDIYINDKLVDVAYDYMSLSGKIGLFVGDSGLHAAFANVVVRSLTP